MVITAGSDFWATHYIIILKTSVGPRLVDANGRKREGFWALSRGTIATVMVSTKEPKGRAMSPICAARRGSTAVFRIIPAWRLGRVPKEYGRAAPSSPRWSRGSPPAVVQAVLLTKLWYLLYEALLPQNDNIRRPFAALKSGRPLVFARYR
jgi:hypothetical protein